MNPIELAHGFEAIDLALHIPEHKTLIVADIHLGMEADLIKSGTMIPRTHFSNLTGRLMRIFETLAITAQKPYERIVVNGDLSHQFGYLSFRELEESSALLKLLREYFNEVILIEGNHDGSLKPLHHKTDKILIGGSFQLDGALYIHGDAEPNDLPDEIERIVIGHEHPAIGLRDRVTGRVEQYKCFLQGKYHDRQLIVIPSLNPLSAGTDLTQERCLSPLLDEESLQQFRVFIVSDEGNVLDFGKLERLIADQQMAGGPHATD